ncbi:MAG: aldo/keto reductase [Propionibacteriales bacterium]|nr:aldo/keto reductase [Propionibacteriales bacterium]
MEQRRIAGVTVGAIGFGAMHLSNPRLTDDAQAVRTMHEALDQGMTLVDTADAYTPDHRGPGHNEEIVAKALASYGTGADEVLVATKGGHTRDGGEWGLNGRPEYIRRAAEASLRRLGVEAIALYQHHRPDPAVPYAETIGAFKDLLDDGLIQRAGLSNANPDQIREAREILGDGLVSVQNQFSPSFRSSEPELELCAELGLAFLPWSPLGGLRGAKELGSQTAGFGEIAEKYSVTPQQVCLAWMLAKSPVVIPIPGASRPESVRSSAAASELKLDPEDLARLDQTG